MNTNIELTKEQIKSIDFVVENLFKFDNFFQKYVLDEENYGDFVECEIKERNITKSKDDNNDIYFLKGTYKFFNKNTNKWKRKKFFFNFYYGQYKKTHHEINGIFGGGSLSIKNDTLVIGCNLYDKTPEY